MTDRSYTVYPPEIIEAFAEAWASIDGKLERFMLDKSMSFFDKGHSFIGSMDGTYQGYMHEAGELLRRAELRIVERGGKMTVTL